MAELHKKEKKSMKCLLNKKKIPLNVYIECNQYALVVLKIKLQTIKASRVYKVKIKTM